MLKKKGFYLNYFVVTRFFSEIYNNRNRKIYATIEWMNSITWYRDYTYKNSRRSTSNVRYGYGSVVVIVGKFFFFIIRYENVWKLKNVNSLGYLLCNKKKIFGLNYVINLMKLKDNTLFLISSYHILKRAYEKSKNLGFLNIKLCLSILSLELRTGSYKPKVILLNDCAKNLTLVDMVVQKAVYIVVFSIFKTIFYKYKNNLNNIKYDVKNTFVLSGLIVSKSFKYINYQIVKTLLKRRIKNEKFLNLYKKLFQFGYINTRSSINITELKKFFIQILFINIYLHIFDLWAKNKKIKFDYGIYTKHAQNKPKYVNLKLKFKHSKKNLQGYKFFYNLRRFIYIRHINFFYIVFFGVSKKQYKKSLLNNICKFLEYSLNAKLSNLLKIQKNFKIKYVLNKFKRRINIFYFLNYLEKKDIINSKKRVIINPKWLISFSIISIIRFYNSIYIQVLKKKNLLKNFKLVNFFYYILKISCTLTLKSKYKKYYTNCFSKKFI